MKLNYAPILKHIAQAHEMQPGDVHKALQRLSPGSVSRRAVGYWFSDPSGKSARSCDSHWVSLLLSSLHLQGKVRKREIDRYVKAMSAINSLVEQDDGNKSFPGNVDMNLVHLVLDSSERRRLQLGHRKMKGSYFPFDPKEAVSSIPGI